jgi:hypothetical protein
MTESRSRYLTAKGIHGLRLLLLATAFLSIPSAYAQGCTQCRDNAAATSPATQKAYRHAIILLTVSAGGLFLATVAILKSQR